MFRTLMILPIILLIFSSCATAQNNSNDFLKSGVNKLDSGDVDEAIKDFTKVIELQPNNFEAYNNRGVIRLETKDFQGAIDDFTKAIEINPLVITYRNRADAYRALKKNELAEADERKVAELEKNK